MSNSVRPHRQQPTRLLHPWDSPGKNTGVGCHFLLQCMKVKSESEVAQSCRTLSDPMDCSLPGSSVHGISQARVLEWGAIAFSRKGALPGFKIVLIFLLICFFFFLLYGGFSQKYRRVEGKRFSLHNKTKQKKVVDKLKNQKQEIDET